MMVPLVLASWSLDTAGNGHDLLVAECHRCKHLERRLNGGYTSGESGGQI